jgi:hypothetical protein
MALGTMGSSSTTGLQSINGFTYSVSAQDAGNLANLIKDDTNPGSHMIVPGAFEQNGRLFIPRRGVLQVLPGDYVGVDANGWPILVSAYSIATGGWTHS